jgi:predicted acetyltransferase
MPFTVRVASTEDFDAIMALLFTAFHDNPDDHELSDVDRTVFEPGRSLLAIDEEGELAGHVGTFTRDLTVPGGVIPAGYVTMVGVSGTHRRQGIASTLLRQQLADIRDRGEPAAVLWASEGRIYQRFGYGMGARRASYTADAREIRLNSAPSPGGRIRAGKPSDFKKDMALVYEAVRTSRPGYASRGDIWWEFLFADPKSRRDGASPQRVAVYYGPSGAEGYVLYRIKQDWEHAGPNSEVWAKHIVTTTPVAYQELWRFLLNIDLTRSVDLNFGSVDEPIFDLVNEPRRLGARLHDGLWLRIVDVPSALAARKYAAGSDLAIEVTDPLFPENNGTFRLDGTATTDRADLTMDIGTLAALYLGGASAGALAAGGRITEHSPGAVATAHTAFTWPVTPVGIDMF